MRFTDYYAEASCTAGRAQFITGQLPIRTGLTTVGQAGAKIGMPAEAPTIATALKVEGYATGQFGKNHLGDLNEYLPTVHGFDEFFGYLYHLDAMEDPSHPNYPPALNDKIGPRNMIHSWATDKDDATVQPRWGKVGKQKIEDAGTLYPERMETVDDEILADALKFIDGAKASGKPFFCWLNPTRMHVKTHLSDKVQEMRTPENGWSIHEAGMAQLDDIVGAVMQKLKDDGLDDNTIVVFTTDNGTENFTWPDGGQTPFAGGKGTVLEGGFRVPCIARWPGNIPAGKVENGIVSGLDWFPTFVAAAGNTTIVDELKREAARRHDLQSASRRLRSNEPDHRQGTVEPARDLLLRRRHAGRSPRQRLQIPLHRPAGRLAWRNRQGRLADHRQPAPGSVRAHRLERIVGILQLVRRPVLAVRPRARSRRESGADVHRLPADAEGRVVQHGSGEGADREGDSVALGRVNGNLFNLGPSGSAQRIHGHLFTAHGSLGHGRDPSKHGRLTRLDPGADGQCCLPVSRCVSPPYLGPAFDDE